jgi:hypothetical protein
MTSNCWRASLVLTLISCSKPAEDRSGYSVLTQIDTIVTAASTSLSRPTEVTVGPDGLLVVVDYGADMIALLDSSGAIVRTIGRTGAGPGELRRPRGLRVLADTIQVLDSENGRIARFSVRGEFLGADVMPPRATGGEISFCPGGGAVLGLNGRHDALAQRLPKGASDGPHLGTLVAPAPAIWDFRALKQEIFDGRVPDAIRNAAVPYCSGDGMVWLLIQTEGRVEAYSARDSLLWQLTLTEPEFPAIKTDFFQKNRQDSSAFRLLGLNYFAQASEIGNRLWVLLRAASGVAPTILVITKEGHVTKRLRVEGLQNIQGFAVDPAHHWLYLLDMDNLAVFRVALPTDVLMQPNPRLQLTGP